jgi:hypothetical protein
MTLETKQSRFVTEFLIGHCKCRWRLHLMVPSIRAIWRKSGQEEESSDHIFCQFPSLAARLEPTDTDQTGFGSSLQDKTLVKAEGHNGHCSGLSARGDRKLPSQ